MAGFSTGPLGSCDALHHSFSDFQSASQCFATHVLFVVTSIPMLSRMPTDSIVTTRKRRNVSKDDSPPASARLKVRSHAPSPTQMLPSFTCSALSISRSSVSMPKHDEPEGVHLKETGQDRRFDDAPASQPRHTKQFKCPECEYCTNYRTNIKAHMRVHTGERPFACTECDASFSWKTNLRDHLRTHAGDKPYVCEQCGAAFARSGTLKKHIKLHAPDGEHVCVTCHARFLEPVALIRHQRSHKVEEIASRKLAMKRNPALTAMAAVISQLDPGSTEIPNQRGVQGEGGSEVEVEVEVDAEDDTDCSACGATFRQRKELEEHDCPLGPLLAAISHLRDSRV